ELGRLDGQMVQNEVQLQVHAHVLKSFQILLPGNHPVDAVVDDGEAPVQIGVEQAGENVKGGKGSLYSVLLEKAYRLGERAAQTVGIGVEHGSKIDFFHRNHLPAAMRCLYSS